MNTNLEKSLPALWIPARASEAPLGALFSFVTSEDPHSPVMASVYEEFVEFLEGQVPFYRVLTDTLSDEDLEDFRIYSVPTLLWIRNGISGDKYMLPVPRYNCEIMLRIVGIVQIRKLQHEAEQLINRIL
jgi:hypothetical protein